MTQRLSGRGMGLLATALIAACGSEGGDFESIESSVVGTCGSCHDLEEFETLLTEIREADNDRFTEAAFPDSMFPLELTERTTADIIARATPERDAQIPPDAADRKAWILSQMHELDLQLRAVPSSDFTNQANFDAYNVFGGDFPAGCETVDRLDGAAEGATTQMPPLYTRPLFQVIGRDYQPLTDSARDAMREFVLGSLPDGASTCFF